ncbi:hypothetical protein [Bermanella sp. R86510]|uniref:hypothetical protein n=1 Tax=unclassified Bermanella TaxID=2627862 RepID=UPI0037C9D2E3
MAKLAFSFILIGVWCLISSYTHAAEIDSDGDGVSDRYEQLLGTDPNNASSIPPDADGNGVPDEYDMDIDGDGVNNWKDAFPRDASRHSKYDANPTASDDQKDSDGDGFSNAVEKASGTNPFDPKSFPDGEGPVLELVELPEVVNEAIIQVRGMAFDMGMGVKKVQVVNGEGEIFPGHFEYTTHFQVKVKLNRGENALQLAAFDDADNITRRFISITYAP